RSGHDPTRRRRGAGALPVLPRSRTRLARPPWLRLRHVPRRWRRGRLPPPRMGPHRGVGMTVTELNPPHPADIEPRAVGTATRVPPHNLDAEQSLLGAMLLNREAILAAVEVGLAADDF